ncbi:MAG: cobalamin-dependent protein [Defluviitaleaceae bacterium]|nr:cobalamin-dependent protein [Defluviitaleaceae bacterium]
MKALLIKPKFENVFTRLSLITTEPLELEYMVSICDRNNVESEICDMTLKKHSVARSVKRFKPDIVGITANFIHIDTVKKYVKQIKKINPNIKVILGGSHAEVKPEDFFFDGIDIVTYSGGFKAFENIIKYENIDLKDIKGIYYLKNSEWVQNEREAFDISDLPFPNRNHFYKNIKKYKYVNLKPCAIVKASYSCPQNCNYCFSTLLNNGKYICREPKNVVEEIKNINCENIWIVDDTFYVDKNKLKVFIDLIKKENIQKNYSLYYRVDFIANNPEIMQELAGIGVKMCAVGLEVIDDEVLKNYNKGTNVTLILKALEVLKKCNITCIGLLMIDIDAEKDYFEKLYKFIEKHELYLSTVSVLTPMPGTEQYEKYKDRFITSDYKKWDFVHLVISPRKMSNFTFYKEFYKLYFKLGKLILKAKVLSPVYLKSAMIATANFWFEAIKSLGGKKQ